jgi:hypothetical protein
MFNNRKEPSVALALSAFVTGVATASESPQRPSASSEEIEATHSPTGKLAGAAAP